MSCVYYSCGGFANECFQVQMDIYEIYDDIVCYANKSQLPYFESFLTTSSHFVL